MDDYPDDRTTEFQHRELMEFLTDNAEMKKAAKHSLRQGLWAGGGAVAGGLLLGPVGGLIGGIAGSIVGFFQADDYSGIVQQLAGLPEERKDVLLSEVRSALTRAGATAKQFESAEAFRGALTEYASQPTVRDQIWRACVHAMKNEN